MLLFEDSGRLVGRGLPDWSLIRIALALVCRPCVHRGSNAVGRGGQPTVRRRWSRSGPGIVPITPIDLPAGTLPCARRVGRALLPHLDRRAHNDRCCFTSVTRRPGQACCCSGTCRRCISCAARSGPSCSSSRTIVGTELSVCADGDITAYATPTANPANRRLDVAGRCTWARTTRRSGPTWVDSGSRFDDR